MSATRNKGTSAFVLAGASFIPTGLGKAETAHLQGFLEMELAGLEPATSWVR